MKSSIILLFLIFCAFTIKAQDKKRNTIDYIKEYYSDFKTGYDYDGKYVSISDNYKAALSGTLFTLTFDVFDKSQNKQNKTVSFNIKKILSIEPYGGDTVEIIDDETVVIPLNGRLLFKTKTEEYNVNIYYEVDNDVEQTEIFKAFEQLVKIK